MPPAGPVRNGRPSCGRAASAVSLYDLCFFDRGSLGGASEAGGRSRRQVEPRDRPLSDIPAKCESTETWISVTAGQVLHAASRLGSGEN